MPYVNEHSCRIADPKRFKLFRRHNNEEEHEGLPVDVVYGITRGKAAIQSLRYKTDYWSEEEAYEHCKSRGGMFEPARPHLFPTRSYASLAQERYGPPYRRLHTKTHRRAKNR